MSTGQTPERGPVQNQPDSASHTSATTYTAGHPDVVETGLASGSPRAAGDTQVPVSPGMAEEQRIQEDIPWGVRIAAAWSWRALIILIAAGVAIWLLGNIVLILVA
ncbi:hypothetical protein, partial [Acinetobacter baumannii]|uniref:hypothetical protein n=1 Tax=Acinetobacter baumannii TaxID=470 RepID=UPI0018E0B584